MELRERLAIQGKNLTALVYRALGLHPESGSIMFEPVNDWPETWIPIRVVEAFAHSGGIEIHGKDVDGQEVVLKSGEWVDRKLAEDLWDVVIPFSVESSRGTELWIVEQRNTMVYTPKCALMISTGLSDASVMKSITSSNGSVRYTRCPIDARGPSECQYPHCLAAMLDNAQPSIKAAKAAFRESVAVALTRNAGNSKMLFLTNGANHLNLVTPEQGVETAWSSGWIQNLRTIMLAVGMEVPSSLEEKLSALTTIEETRAKEVEEAFNEAMVEQVISEEVSEAPENIVLKEKKPKKRKAKKKADADLSELDSEEMVLEAKTAEEAEEAEEE